MPLAEYYVLVQAGAIAKEAHDLGQDLGVSDRALRRLLGDRAE